MLEILKGKSVKTYENEFFRKISAELFELFERKSWSGVLIGMPECVTKDGLQIDCLLLTQNQMIVIDFKNYRGVLNLPSPHDFKYGRWVLNKDVTVKGGSAPNPYAQLQRQRARLIQELQSRIQSFDKSTVSTMVCFHDAIETIGEIPHQFQLGFSIADPSNYLNKIVDTLDVMGHGNLNYLSDSAKRVFTQIVFQANPYHFNETIDEVIPEPVLKTSNDHKHQMKEIHDFLCSDQKIMTVTGNTKSGKTALIPHIRDLAFDANYTHVPVFAYSNRLKQKMLQSHPNLEEVESLFSSIFDFSTDDRDENYKKVIPLKMSHPLSREENSNGAEISVQDKTLYIIDDSQLITNSKLHSDDIQYGSGHLLNDLLDHINLEERPDTKIIFVGDVNKLSFGSDMEDALQANYLQSLLKQRNLISNIAHIELPDNKSENEIIKTCNQISSQIKQGQFNSLSLSSYNELSVNEVENKEKVMEAALQNPHDKKIIVYTNNKAGKINQWIKQHFLKNGSHIGPRDLLIFNSPSLAVQKTRDDGGISQDEHPQNSHFAFPEVRQVHNGMFGEVLRISHSEKIEKNEMVDDKNIVLRFVPCVIRLMDGVVIETLVLENFLNAEKNELELNEQIAYHRVLAKLEANEQEKSPFSESPEFEEMIRHPETYAKIERAGKILYRDSSDSRKLTSYEKAYRHRILKELNNPEFEYFKILNAAKVKFGWAMTVNKAMVYTFNEVFFITDDENRGRTNKEYFRWLYTGISTALNKVYLINWKPISPFMKINFSDAPEITSYKKRPKNIFSFVDDQRLPADHLRTYVNERLSGVGAVKTIVSRPYLEMVTLEVDSEDVEVHFNYTGKREMRSPKFKSGSQAGYEKLLSLLTFVDKDLVNELGVMRPFIEELSQHLQNADIQLRVIKAQDWELILQFHNHQEYVEVQTYYNGKGMVSKFNYLDGDVDVYKQVVELIQKRYVLT
ncbi:NERD domain-containing protein [Exiguobacterium chiriqhucha]|uniref:NERD domain-containing protein n=1 Tax=Exiguobacterium chiriqhucha RW-2 TaxID=1345023 RepID=U1M085_9BACL|nr:NERD domain-containing protein [Exiguobacterium chiriqhucha]ERG68072.1 hypothetical protein M467_12350 [Exiguobacterium chiriqhucha RW-2]